MQWEPNHQIFALKYIVDNVLPASQQTADGITPKQFYAVTALMLGYVLSAAVWWHLDFKHVDIRGRSGTRKDFMSGNPVAWAGWTVLLSSMASCCMIYSRCLSTAGLRTPGTILCTYAILRADCGTGSMTRP